MRNFFTLLVVALATLACSPNGTNKASNDSESVRFSQHIEAFTNGLIFKRSNIEVRFSSEIEDAKAGAKAADDIMTISPKVAGTFTWADKQSLVFTPSEDMKSGQMYNMSVDVGEVIRGTSDKFTFKCQIISQHAKIDTETLLPYSIYNLKDNQLKGELAFTDNISFNLAKEAFSATQEGNNLKIEWSESGDNNKSFNFTIHNVKRSDKASEINLKVDGKKVGIKSDITRDITVAALGNFAVESQKIGSEPNQFIEILFTEPLLPSQNLDGLITLDSGDKFTTRIENNIITVFPTRKLSGSVELKLFTGISSVSGDKLKSNINYQLSFEAIKPAVEFIGKGSILPESSSLSIPFRAVGLREVQVRIIKIFQNNIASFLQSNNNFDGTTRLHRAGRLVLKKTLPLDTDKSTDLNQWNSFSIDLDKLIEADRGSIYRIELAFKRVNSIYPDAVSSEERESYNPNDDDIITDSQMAYFNTPNDYYYEEYTYHPWNERNDPTKDGYYTKNRYAVRNILASDIGIIAKRGEVGSMVVAVTDIRTTEPLEGVTIELYDYQNQLINSATSNQKGLVHITPEGKPFILIAKKDKQRGYMRLDDGVALPTTNFDVLGVKVEHGLKGYIYGERGVWRPGDDIHLSFMLEDKLNTIPDGHPIILEVTNSLSQTISRQTVVASSDNLYSFKVTTKADAPTGNYEARVRVGNSIFSKRLRIESVKPNRLKVELNFDNDIIKAATNSVNATLKASWLHGAVAANLRGKVELSFTPLRTQFKEYKEYNFDNPAKEYPGGEIVIFDGKIDDRGIANISEKLSNSYYAPGMLTARVRSRVFEASGDFSTNYTTIPYSPYKSYVGIKTPQGDKKGILYVNKKHKIDVVRVNEEGQPLLGNKRLKYTIYKINWRWWWESSNENLARYVNASSTNVIESGNVEITNGLGSFDFQINHPDWGRYLIVVNDPESGHSAGSTIAIDWEGYANKPVGDNVEDASILAISTDKDSYDVGETATVTFATNEGSRALVTIEDGVSVLKEEWVETTKNFTTYSFKVDKSMTPNIYIGVTMLQPHSQTKNNLPIRLYGIVPVTVEDKANQIKPVIAIADEVRPKESVTIGVSEASGQAMSFTVAVVEEGLLDLTNYKTPNPNIHLNAREALGVKTWDIYNSVIGAYGGKIESIFGIGGDGELQENDSPTTVNRFEPIVKMFGPFKIATGETKNITFEMPEYIGSVRTMVVACSNGKYGSSEKRTAVRKPLMALATLPRVVSIGEEVTLPVTIFAMNDNIDKVNITVESLGGIDIVGNNKNTLTFKEIGDKIVPFKLKIGDKSGSAAIKVTARSGNEVAVHNIGIEIRNPNPKTTKLLYDAIPPSSTKSLEYSLSEFTAGSKVWIECSTIKPIDYERRLKYLRSYPHSCVEQTTSSVFPLLYADKFCKISPQEHLDNQTRIENTIKQLLGYTTVAGGFAYWRGEQYNNDWGTSYAGHFLIEAEKVGYSVPSRYKSRWVDYQTKAANQWSDNSRSAQLNQAYRLYTLALAGKPNNSAMNRMLNIETLSLDAAYRLAAAYAIIGHNDVAEKLLKRQMKINDRDYSYSYGSPLRNRAMVLETLSLLKRDNEALPLIDEISSEMSSENWMSTQTLAYCMISLSRWAPTNGDNTSFSISIDGGNTINHTTNLPIYTEDISNRVKNSGKITFANQSSGTLFARIIAEGTTKDINTESKNENINMTVEYLNLNGSIINVKKIAQGTDFMAVVTIEHPNLLGTYNDLTLSQIFPSGWEIRNMRMDGGKLPISANEPRYKDIRDDRIYSYFDLEPRQKLKFVVLLNASYKGRFILPAVTCEAMYNNAISAHSSGMWVEVI